MKWFVFAASVLVSGCSIASEGLAPGDEMPPPDEPAVPQPVPQHVPQPVPQAQFSPECARPPTVQWTSEDMTSAELFQHPCTEEVLDENGCVGARTLNAFDERGLLVRSEVQIFDPSVVPATYSVPASSITHFDYDERGRRIESRFDADADGTVDDVEVTGYDDEDREVTRTRFRDGDQVDRTWRYDERDRVLETTTRSVDGHRIERTEYDGDLRVAVRIVEDDELIHERTYRFDDQARPLLERQWTPRRLETTHFVYTSRGLITREWSRHDQDRLVNIERHTYTRRPDGTPSLEVLESINGLNMGVLKRRRTSFDEAGRTLRVESDDGADGSVDWWRENAFDENGNQTLFKTVRGTEILMHVVNVYDAAGQRLEQRDLKMGVVLRIDYDDQQRPTSSTRTRLDGTLLSSRLNIYEGRRTVSEHDLDGDGVVDRRNETIVDHGERFIAANGDGDGDGVWDHSSAWVYDAAGQRLYEFTDAGADGSREAQTLATWACQRP